MELLYRQAEWLTAMQAVRSGSLEKAEQEKLTKGWKLILTNQFHDIIPGSSIHEVYEDSRHDYEKIREIGTDVIRDYFDASLEKEEKTWTVYNASGWSMNEIVAVPTVEAGEFSDGEGNVLETQKGNGVTYVYVKDVPAMGHRTIFFRGNSEAEAAENEVFKVNGREIETPFYSMAVNEYRQIEKLYDKEAQRSVLAQGERGNVLQMFEDKPIDNDAWDIDIYYQQKMREVTDLKKFEVKECGPLRLVIGLSWNYMNTVIEQDMILYAEDRRIDFSTKVDFKERQQLLKTAFPVDIRTTYATYDIQYGNVRRPNHWNTSWDQARFESVGHRFADLSERNYGVALMNDCKYGYDVKGNVLRLSLLRSGKQPDHIQDVGEHVFTYSLLPHMGDIVSGDVVPSAHALNNPMLVQEGKETADGSFFTVDNSQVEIDAVKKSEDGKHLVVRFHDFAGSGQKVTLKPNFRFRSWTEGDLRERKAGETHGEEAVSMKLHPFEIKTILFEL